MPNQFGAGSNEYRLRKKRYFRAEDFPCLAMVTALMASGISAPKETRPSPRKARAPGRATRATQRSTTTVTRKEKRVIQEKETRKVRGYLSKKHGK